MGVGYKNFKNNDWIFLVKNGHQTLSVAIDKPIFLYVTNPSFLPQGVKA